MTDKTKKKKPSKALPEWQGVANKRRTRGLIGTELLQIFEIYDDTEVAAHLVNILKSKGIIIGHKEEKHKIKDKEGNERIVTIEVPVYRDPFYMKDAETLKEIETYRAKLDEKAIEQDEG